MLRTCRLVGHIRPADRTLESPALNKLRLEPDDRFNYSRTDEESYLELVQRPLPRILKKDAFRREAPTPHERSVLELNKKFWKQLIFLLSLHYLKMSFALKPAFAPT
jgi:hypothetical protein